MKAIINGKIVTPNGIIEDMALIYDEKIQGIVDLDQISDEEVMEAVRLSCAEEFVNRLPGGLDYMVAERGSTFSTGERQLISFARAIAHKPRVLVLDEATSALDNDTEAAIMDSINRLHGKKTLVIIAHRLQTIEKCDMVFRVEDGKINRER